MMSLSPPGHKDPGAGVEPALTSSESVVIPLDDHGRSEQPGRELNPHARGARPSEDRVSAVSTTWLALSAEGEGVEPSRLAALPGSSRVPSPVGLPFRSSSLTLTYCRDRR